MSYLEQLCRKHDRFSIKALDKHTKELMDKLEYLERIGLLISRKVIRCDECGSDLGLFEGQEKVFCPMCNEERYVFEDMIEKTFFRVDKRNEKCST